MEWNGTEWNVMYVCMYVCIYVYICIYVFIYIYMYMYICIYIYVSICIYMCVCIHYVYIYTYNGKTWEVKPFLDLFGGYEVNKFMLV